MYNSQQLVFRSSALQDNNSVPPYFSPDKLHRIEQLTPPQLMGACSPPTLLLRTKLAVLIILRGQPNWRMLSCLETINLNFDYFLFSRWQLSALSAA